MYQKEDDKTRHVLSATKVCAAGTLKTPLQWNAVDSNAGFTAADTIPWLLVSKDYTNVNVEAQQKDLNSMWHTAKNLLTIRQGSEVLNHGSYTDKYVGDVNNKHGHEELFIYQWISDWRR